MKKILTYLAFAGLPLPLVAQTSSLPADYDRSATLVSLAPFYHGVASGDPTPESVILWTRITTDSSQAPISWRIALDTAMTQIVDSGTVTATAQSDYTAKVDVQGLQANTFYFYEFEYYGRYSVRGRTRTLPSGSIDSLRFGVVSCSNYDNGYFNAYARLTERNDIDLILHLGDYIYEYGNGESGSERSSQPTTEIIDLGDYRMRHSHYKLDPDLMRLHQQYPFISVWDDHETANDSWSGGADNHDPQTEGDWITRKSAGIRAYFEWMPIRLPDPTGDTTRIYRRFRLGDLVELHMLDTRLQARDEQDGTSNTSASRTLLGQTQFNWLIEGMDTSTARWQLLGQQVMMAPLNVQPISWLPPIYANADQWDGYPAERQRLYDSIMSKNIQNFVVLTGDIHTAWAQDLPLSNYQPGTGANSVGVEFVTTSITSEASPLPVSQSIIQSANRNVKYSDLTKKGYLIIDITRQRLQGDFYTVGSIDQIDSTQSLEASWAVFNGTRYLQQAARASQANPNRIGVQAPMYPRQLPPVAVWGLENSTWLSIYPNPATTHVALQYSLAQAGEVGLSLWDMQGRLVQQWPSVQRQEGVHRERVQLQDLPAGSYVLRLDLPNQPSATRILQKR